jgi:hypothetical protein
MASPRTTKEEKAKAVEYLREWLKPGDTVYCILRHVSRSGMQRVIDLIVIEERPSRPQIYHAGYNAARACGYRYDRDRQGVVVNGTGMDMGFALVYDLGAELFGKAGSLKHEWL